MISEPRPRHIHGYGRQGIGWQQAEHYRVRTMVAEAALEQMREKVAELEAKLATPRPASAALRDVIAKLPRYELHHCNDMGEDYMSRCYVVAVPDNGGEELMAGRSKWIRADALAAALARAETDQS